MVRMTRGTTSGKTLIMISMDSTEENVSPATSRAQDAISALIEPGKHTAEAMK